MKRILCVLFVCVLFVCMLFAGCAAPAKTSDLALPASGKYCVLGVDGKQTYPEYTALQFDFENKRFDFGVPFTDSSWVRAGTLNVEGNRITAVSNTHKSVPDGDGIKITGNYTWIFEFTNNGRLRFVPDGSDVFDVYGTQLNADSVLVFVGELDRTLR